MFTTVGLKGYVGVYMEYVMENQIKKTMENQNESTTL